MHARVVLGVGKGVLLERWCPHLEGVLIEGFNHCSVVCVCIPLCLQCRG